MSCYSLSSRPGSGYGNVAYLGLGMRLVYTATYRILVHKCIFTLIELHQ